jgi:hypothetical protein
MGKIPNIVSDDPLETTISKNLICLNKLSGMSSREYRKTFVIIVSVVFDSELTSDALLMRRSSADMNGRIINGTQRRFNPGVHDSNAEITN